MAGRPKKPVALKKLEGTYRKDRDGETEQQEEKLNALLPSGRLSVPKSITEPAIKKAYKNHVELLRALGTMAEQKADSPILEDAYYSLQVAYRCRDKMTAEDISEEDLKTVTELYIKFMDRFEKLAKDFYLTPKERAKLKLDVLTATEKEQNIVKNQSVIASLLEKKQS